MEDLVISAVYAGLLNAKLNPLRSVVQVSSVAPLRDIQSGTVPSIVATLQNWSQRCDATLAEIEANIANIKREAARKASDKREWDRTFQAVVKAEISDPSDPAAGSISANGTRGAGRRLGGGAAGRTGLRSNSGVGAGGPAAAGGGGGGGAGSYHGTAVGAGSGSKRGMEKLTEGVEDDDDEAMDLDDSADATSQNQKRTSRRKL